MLEKFVDHNCKDKVFLLRNLIEVRIPLEHYHKLSKRFEDDYIVSFGEPKQIVNRVTRRNLIYIESHSWGVQPSVLSIEELIWFRSGQ